MELNPIKNILKSVLLYSFFVFGSNAQNTEFWGMTYYGGSNNGGVILKTDGNGNNQNVQFSFERVDGYNPFQSGLCELPNGRLYGLLQGGIYNQGIIYEYDPVADSYTKKFQFQDTLDGYSPEGKLLLASNGKLYGATLKGGINGLGVLFEYDFVNNIYTKKFDFNGINGSRPSANLMEAANGQLFGVTSQGGVNAQGVIFEYNFLSNTFNKRVDFDSSSSLSGSVYGLVKFSNGNLYGVTKFGGTNGIGSLFEYNPTSFLFTEKVNFDGVNLGSLPNGALIVGSDNKLYGTTNGGGSLSDGVLYQYDPITNIFAKKIDFDKATKGGKPIGGVIEKGAGVLYGLTSLGGVNGGPQGNGVLFAYNFNTNVFTKKIDFNNLVNGKNPDGLLITTSSGIYGTTPLGGTANSGTLFRYNDNTNNLTVKIMFEESNSGKVPASGLLQASNGNMYGLTVFGGANNFGVLFEYNPYTNIYSKKFDFNDIDGRRPSNTMIQASNGKLYGTVRFGGGSGVAGLLFEYDINTNTYTKKVKFNTIASGRNPFGSLMQASNGKIYGTTYAGGADNAGVIYEYDFVTDVYTKKIDLDSLSTGINPFGGLIEYTNGKLYGMNSTGGLYNQGTLYEYDINTNVLVKKVDFDSINKGKLPSGDLTIGPNGKLYGLASRGGINNAGVLFEYDPQTNSYNKKIDFDSLANGTALFGTLKLGSNGKLYGMAAGGGLNNLGTIFEYDAITNVIVKKSDYNFTNGASPGINSFTEICATSIASPINTSVPANLSICPNSSTTLSASASGTINWYASGSGGSSIASGSTFVTPVLNTTTTYYVQDISCAASPRTPITVNVFQNSVSVNGSNTITANASGMQYQWIDCNNGNAIISGAIGQSYTPTSNGSYAVVISNGIACSDTSACVLVSNVGINSLSLSKSSSLYPNPNSGTFILMLDTESEISIFDFFGKDILTRTLPSGRSTLDLGKIHQGVYFVRINNGRAGQYYLKFVVEDVK
jgi:uncharacterized repeat protein (TIGR03803 family)